MGLAGPRKRQKISHDPNNTSWARDTTGFGHKILSQQGWKPGDFLGAEGAAHASHFTAASASHVRVTLKDDTLGIGAQRRGETAETFGLGGLADIYGRLNGKDTTKEFKEKQKARADIGRMLYIERRYGPSNFVSGGFLVGDTLKSLEDTDDATNVKGQLQDVRDTSKPRDKAQDKAQDKTQEKTQEKQAKKDKKEKTDKKRRKKAAELEADASTSGEAEVDAGQDPATSSKGLDKEERRRRKQERRERRERKQAKREGRVRDNDEQTPADGGEATKEAQPAVVTASPAFGGSRQMVRRRFIQSKRMAAMDPRAMKEILMAR